VDIANTAMKNIELPNETQEHVRSFLIMTQGTHLEQDQLKKFLEMISPTLQTEVSKSIFTEIVQRNKTLCAYFKEMAMQQVGTYKQSLADQDLETNKDMRSLQKDL
jgi:hypothetical protein